MGMNCIQTCVKRPHKIRQILGFSSDHIKKTNVGLFRQVVAYSHRTTDCFDDRLLLRRQIKVNFAEKG